MVTDTDSTVAPAAAPTTSKADAKTLLSTAATTIKTRKATGPTITKPIQAAEVILAMAEPMATTHAAAIAQATTQEVTALATAVLATRSVGDILTVATAASAMKA